MKNLKRIFFLGLGGAGQRHLRVIKSLCPEAQLFAYRSTSRTPVLTVGFEVDSGSSLEAKYGIQMLASYEAGLNLSPDLVVISTPSSLHMKAALKALQSGASVLVEKPFSHNLEGFEELQALAKQKNLMLATSFQRRFNPHFQTIRNAISEKATGKISSAVFNISSYLPSWHKYEDYREMYASREELGGGVLLTEIHEIDLCAWFFGVPLSVFCSGGSLSGEDLPVEDTVALILNYKDFVVSLNIGFMNKKVRREFQVNGSATSFEWIESQNVLKTFDHKKGAENVLSSPISSPDELFEKQFSEILKSEMTYSESDFEKARLSVQIVEAAKRSMKSGRVEGV